MALLRVDCAWCKRTMVEGPPEIISHGICDDCYPLIHPDLGWCPVCKRQGFISTGPLLCRCEACKVGIFTKDC